jgi:hypothetical protein
VPSGIVAIVPPASEPALAAASPPASEPAPGFTLTPQGAQPAPAATSPAPDRRLADIAAVLRDLPRENSPQSPPPREAAAVPTRPANTGRQPATVPSRPSATAAGRGEERTAANAQRREARPRRPAPPAHPSRHWVQVAGGANRATLPREFARLRTLAPRLLGGRTAYTTPLRATNRLLVGPFASAREAQAFVNQLAASNVPAFAWTSEAGQEIERLQTPR